MKELKEFLELHPELIPMQMEIDRVLETLDSSENRMYYLSVELSSKADELADTIEELNRRVNEFRR